MKHLQRFMLTLACAASLIAPGSAAMMGSSAAAHVQPWLGTWTCKAAGNNHTATFSPIFGGSGMRISETGKPSSEELILWDTKRQKWIDQYTDATGAYSTMEGTQTGNNAYHFVTVYPTATGGPTLSVMMPNKTTYKTIFTGMMNGKTMVQHETCTKT
jgi:hypothetical protein